MTVLLSVICLAAGAALCIVEMFVPGFGLPGIGGGLLLVLGTGLLYKAAGAAALIVLILLVAALIAVLMWVLRYASSGMLAQSPLFLREKESIPQKASGGLAGREGEALTVLRPSGTAVFGNMKVDVTADAEYIPAGARVRVVSDRGRFVTVTQIKEEEKHDD